MDKIHGFHPSFRRAFMNDLSRVAKGGKLCGGLVVMGLQDVVKRGVVERVHGVPGSLERLSKPGLRVPHHAKLGVGRFLRHSKNFIADGRQNGGGLAFVHGFERLGHDRVAGLDERAEARHVLNAVQPEARHRQEDRRLEVLEPLHVRLKGCLGDDGSLLGGAGVLPHRLGPAHEVGVEPVVVDGGSRMLQHGCLSLEGFGVGTALLGSSRHHFGPILQFLRQAGQVLGKAIAGGNGGVPVLDVIDRLDDPSLALAVHLPAAFGQLLDAFHGIGKALVDAGGLGGRDGVGRVVAVATAVHVAA